MTTTNPANILKQISQYNDEKLPPVHLWNPPLCKNVEMRIDREGRWFFMNSPIGRQRMVKLFSKVLRLDDDGEYYLVTPVEKIRIEVEERPFLVIDYQIIKKNGIQLITFETNTGDKFILDDDHPINFLTNSETDEPKPYVLVRSNLEGIISRNIYYKLVNLAIKKETKGKQTLVIKSNNKEFIIGKLEA
tara:strand:+ start:2205 stop:2774 length:570 start_codon:yes stop_codon:yes gene_type:complete